MKKYNNKILLTSSLFIISAFLFVRCTHPSRSNHHRHYIAKPANLAPQPKPSSSLQTTPTVVAKHPTYVSVNWTEPNCATIPPSVPFNSKNIDPVFNPNFEKPLFPLTRGLVRLRFRLTHPIPKTTIQLQHNLTILLQHDTAQINNDPPKSLYRIDNIDDLEIVTWLLGRYSIVEFHDAKSGLEILTQLIELPAPYDDFLPTISGMTPSLASSRSLCSPRQPLQNDTFRVKRYFPVDLAAYELPPSTQNSSTLPTSLARAAEKLAALDPTLRLIPADNSHALAETTSPGLESLICNGVKIDNLTVEAPWSAVDPDFIRWSKFPPVEIDGVLRTDLSYKSSATVSALLDELHRRFPNKTSRQTIGYSTAKRPIEALSVKIGNPSDNDPSLFIDGSIHGNEPLSTEIVFAIINLLLPQKGASLDIPKSLQNMTIWFVPMVNTDGNHDFLYHSQFDGRKNGRPSPPFLNSTKNIRTGVDLNRNFPIKWGSIKSKRHSNPSSLWYQGPFPGSEPEVQALMTFTKKIRPAVAISYHTGTTAILTAYTINGLKNPVPDWGKLLGEKIVEKLNQKPYGKSFDWAKDLYPVSGVEQDWLRQNLGTLAILIESSRSSPKGWCQRHAQTRAGVEAFKIMLHEIADCKYGVVPCN